jgi:hypothetical protein
MIGTFEFGFSAHKFKIRTGELPSGSREDIAKPAVRKKNNAPPAIQWLFDTLYSSSYYY